MLFRRLAVITAFLSLAAVALPASAAGWCFCTLPNEPAKFGSCAGKTNHQGPSQDQTTCDNTCRAAGLGNTGQFVLDYNDPKGPIDWVYQGECLGPNTAQTSDAARAEQKKYKESGEAAKNQALGSSTKGSTIGLTLPMSAVSPQQVIGRIIKAVLGIVGTLAFVMFLYGGLRWMVARGRAEEITKAKQTIIWATLGLIVIFAAYGLVSTLISGVSGIK